MDLHRTPRVGVLSRKWCHLNPYFTETSLLSPALTTRNHVFTASSTHVTDELVNTNKPRFDILFPKYKRQNMLVLFVDSK